MKSNVLLPAILIVIFALSRIPGLMPLNFSVAYAFAFCAGVYFRGAMKWWLPLAIIVVTDLSLNFYYQHKGFTVWDLPDLANLFFNYVAYAVLIFLGSRFKPKSSLWKLVGGGMLGSILFYIITNTASWFFNPFHNVEYAKTLAGWFLALTKGIGGYPSTWEFFRNTLLSGALFTALFAIAEKTVTAAESPADKTAGAREPAAEAEPEEAKA
ncbi:MAG TPA: DUF6580 family putative transport protein [Verrucomicrobiae bacterium]